jgi:hypothetical protein
MIQVWASDGMAATADIPHMGDILNAMSTVDRWKRRLQRLGFPERPRAERLAASCLAARLGESRAASAASIKNLSSTGVYLLTEERWPLGELISLTLQGQGSPEIGPEFQIPVEARVSRHGEDGVGLSFVLPSGLDAKLWGVLVRNAVLLTDAKSILLTFRTLQAILFVNRLCQAAADESILLLGGELDESRTECALEIALRAEKLLASEPDASSMRAVPHLVASILKNGSWAVDNVTRQLWAGLLAASCSAEGTDESGSAFVDLLIHLTPAQSRIFVASCSMAMEFMSGREGMPLTRIILMPEEMFRLTDTNDISRIAVDIAYLCHAGFIEKNFDFTSYLPTESFDLTPSSLGLDLYKRCRGDCAKDYLLEGEGTAS